MPQNNYTSREGLRLVYKAKFPDGYSYIGTTDDYERRVADHLFNDKKSEVYNHKRHTGLIPKFSILHDYTSIEESDRLEFEYSIKCACEGEILLNKQRPGGFGGLKKKAIDNNESCSSVVDDSDSIKQTPFVSTENSILPYKIESESSDRDVIYDILLALCIRAQKEEVPFLYVNVKYLPEQSKYFSQHSTNFYRFEEFQFSGFRCLIYFDIYKRITKFECCDFEENIKKLPFCCKYVDKISFSQYCDNLYSKCYVFKNAKLIKSFCSQEEIRKKINKAASDALINHDSTNEFRTSLKLEDAGYDTSCPFSRLDYAIYLTRYVGDLFTPHFECNVDQELNLTYFGIRFCYNAYSLATVSFSYLDSINHEDQFSHATNIIDTRIHKDYHDFDTFPMKFEFCPIDLGIDNIDTLRAFMRCFYVAHGIAWDTGEPDSTYCHIDNFNGSNLKDCIFVVEIQGNQFLRWYNLETHQLDKSNSWLEKELSKST